MKLKLIMTFVCLSTLFSCSKDEIYETNGKPNKGEDVQYNDTNTQKGKIRIYVSEALASQLESTSKTKSPMTNALTEIDFSNINIKSIERVFPYSGKFEQRAIEANLHRWYEITFDDSTPVSKVAKRFTSKDGVEIIELRPTIVHYKAETVFNLNQYISYNEPQSPMLSKTTQIFDDPQLADQWHYANTLQHPDFVKGSDINVNNVWKNGVTGHRDVIVAVLDTGVEVTHPDLKANVYVNEAELNGVKGIDDDGNGYIDDVHGYNFVNKTGTIKPYSHGTHVAGTVAAENNNGIGVAGVAGGDGTVGSGARIMSVQILGGGEGNIAAAMQYAANNGAIISQNSWGYGPTLVEISGSDKAAVDYFVENAGKNIDGSYFGPIKGGIVVFAAGNNKTMHSNPGGYENVVSVTATGPDNKKATYTNYGKDWADIAAPGGDETKWNNNLKYAVLSTDVGGTYTSKSGTSMACPQVSGAIALYIGKLINENTANGTVPAQDVIDRLLKSTRSLKSYEPNFYADLGTGLLDVSKFIGGESTIAPEKIDDLAQEGDTSYGSVSLSWTVPADTDDVSATDFDVIYSKDQLIGNEDINALPEGVELARVGDYVPALGEKIITNVSELDPNTTYYFGIFAKDYSGNISDLSNIISAKTAINKVPVIESMSGAVDNIILTSAENKKIQFRLSDPEGFDLKPEYFKGSAAETSYTYNNSTKIYSIFLNAIKVDPGSYSSKLVVTDIFGGKSEVEIKYTVKPNTAPTVVKPFESVVLNGIGETKTFKLSEYITDADGETLSVTLSSSHEKIIAAKYAADVLTVTALGYGSSEITVTAVDGKGKTVIETFNVSSEQSFGLAHIYPNPVSNDMNINTKVNEIEKIKISNSTGAVVFEKSNVKTIDGTTIIDMTKYSKGIYFVDLMINGESVTKKITKI